MAIIELDEISKWYGEVIGLNDVSARIGTGITGLVGPNGAGKSTLMGLATGQLRPSRGRISVFGERPWDRPRLLRRLGFCPEGDRFWPAMSGFRFVCDLARMSGLGARQARRQAAAAIEQVSMTEHAQRPIKTYSKGMRQRIKVAQAIVHDPELLILDEPFTGADPVARHQLAVLFRGLAAQGRSLLISSHVLHEVESLTRQIMMIDHGRVVAEGTVQGVRSQLSNRPHAIRIRIDDARGLGSILLTWPEVSGIKVTAEDVLVIETTRPDQVNDRLGEALLTDGRVVREVAAADESLEAVFGYLTERTA